MGNNLLKDKEEFTQSIKETFEYEDFAKKMSEFINKKSNLSYQVSYGEEIEEISTLYQKQFQFFIYLSVEELDKLSSKGHVDNETAKKIQFWILNLEKILNFIGRCKIRKLEDILWKTSNYKVDLISERVSNRK